MILIVYLFLIKFYDLIGQDSITEYFLIINFITYSYYKDKLQLQLDSFLPLSLALSEPSYPFSMTNLAT